MSRFALFALALAMVQQVALAERAIIHLNNAACKTLNLKSDEENVVTSPYSIHLFNRLVVDGVSKADRTALISSLYGEIPLNEVDAALGKLNTTIGKIAIEEKESAKTITLGAEIIEVNHQLFISRIHNEKVAAKSGLRLGDEVTHVGNKRVRSIMQLLAALDNGPRAIEVKRKLGLRGVEPVPQLTSSVGVWSSPTISDTFVKDHPAYDFFSLMPNGKFETDLDKWAKKRGVSTLPKNAALPKDNELVILMLNKFRGKWENPFTSIGLDKFHIDDEKTNVFFMNGKIRASASLTKTDGNAFLTLILPYQGNEFEFCVFMPESAKLNSKLIREELLRGIESARSNAPQLFEIAMPRFRISSSAMINGDEQDSKFRKLSSWGGLLKNPDAKLESMIQSCELKVDEHGTTAESVLLAKIKSIGVAKEIVVNRPFLFAIIHKESKLIVFVGRCVNPSLQK